jgi:flagellar motor switch protein FliN/FliY
MQLLSISFAKSLVEELLVPSAEGTATSIEKESDLNEKQTEQPAAEYIQHEETQQAEPVHVPVDVQPASFSEFEHVSSPQGDSRNLDMLLDIPLQVTVELGRTKRTVQEILALSSGSIIELDKLAGEPVDILINSKLIAKGEVVVIDENFGVRVTDIISQRDRINKLK